MGCHIVKYNWRSAQLKGLGQASFRAQTLLVKGFHADRVWDDYRNPPELATATTTALGNACWVAEIRTAGIAVLSLAGAAYPESSGGHH